jgi:hypothetical protein
MRTDMTIEFDLTNQNDSLDVNMPICAAKRVTEVLDSAGTGCEKEYD